MGAALMADVRVMTVEEVAERLKVSEWTVRSWLRSGRLRGFRLGGTKAGWRVEEDELRRFVSQLRDSTETEKE